MNDNHSRSEMKYLERWLTPTVLESIKTYPVVVLTGARQVGKSTFLHHAPQIKNWSYLTLDDFDVLETAQKNPKALLADKENIVIDEIQRAPKLLSAIKREVDESGGEKCFVLSGSANLLLMQKVSESLAGRAVYHVMHPFSFGETEGRPPLQTLDQLFSGSGLKKHAKTQRKGKLEDLIIRGYFPQPVVQFKKISDDIVWLDGFVATFLERDLRQLAQIDNLPDFRRLMAIMALRSGQMLNQSEVSRDANIPQPTAHRYINLLETSFLFEKIPAYAISRTKRLIKTPKVYWGDSGLAAFLMGYYEPNGLRKVKEWGALFETLIFNQLKIWTSLKKPSPKIYYWRTTAGQEIDFVIEWGKKLIAIEVKAAQTVRHADADKLAVFLKEYPETTAGLIIYSGKNIKQIAEKIWAIPWELLV